MVAWRSLIRVLFLMLGLLAGGAPGLAQEIYTATGIAVDVTGDIAGLRERAMLQGRRAALKNVLMQIADPAAVSALPMPNDAELEDWVSDFEIEQEKIAANHYIGRFTFRFAAEPVRAFLAENGISFLDTVANPVLVVPVYRDAGGAPLLWEPANPWLTAWRSAPGQGHALPIIVPSGDAADRAGLSAEQALAADAAHLTALGRRYGAGAIVVATAQAGAPLTGPENALSLTVLPIGFEQATPRQLTVTAAGGDEAVLLAEGVAAVRAAVEAEWRQGALVDPNRRSQLAVSAPLDSLQQWVAIKRNLAKVALLKGVDLRELSPREARLELSYVGSEAQLSEALAGSGLALEMSGEGEAILSLVPGANSTLP